MSPNQRNLKISRIGIVFVRELVNTNDVGKDTPTSTGCFTVTTLHTRYIWLHFVAHIFELHIVVVTGKQILIYLIMMNLICICASFILLVFTRSNHPQCDGFAFLTSIPSLTPVSLSSSSSLYNTPSTFTTQLQRTSRSDLTQLYATLPQQQDIEVIQLVVGQENYGLAIVCVGEALWSFLSAPSVDHIKVLIPAGIAAAVLVLVSGPMITSGDVDSIGTGLWIATATSTALGVSYLARMIAPYSPSPKEIAGLGLLVAVAGFFSFAQNLLVDGFVILPSLPTIAWPDLNGIIGTVDVVPDVTSTSTVIETQSLLPIELPTTVPEIPVN